MEVVKAAVVQAGSVIMDRDATVEKTSHLAREAAAQGGRRNLTKTAKCSIIVNVGCSRF